jgi:RNA polymerase sigma factor (sigma-70 family)
MLRNEPDEALAALVRQGHESAFVAIYDRHHRGLIAFCRHMLSSKEEAEDALQHTFLAAYKSLTGNGRPPKTLKPWLYTIAHNRCVSVLRARRTHEPADESNDGLADPGLADVVQRRADLRDLLGDLHRLPEDQKAALVLFEMGDFSHADIAETLSVTREKVKALVFQAREGLLRARTARDTPCAEIRRDLSSRTRALPRRGVVRGHLDRCPACAAFDLEVRRQRAALALVLPVVPSLELKGSVLGPMLGGGASIAGGGALIAGGSGAGAGGIAIGGAGAAATAGGGAAGTAAAGGVAGLATSAGGLAGAGAASGLGALAAKTVVAKALTVVAVATAAAGTGKVAEEVHDRVTAPSHAISAPAEPKPAASVVTSNEPTTTTLLPGTHITQTTTTSTPAPVTSTATTAATPPTSTGGTATVPTSSSPSTPAGGASTSAPSSTPADTAVDPTTGGTTAPAVVVNADPPAPASTPAADPPAASTDPPATTQDPPATTDPNTVGADVAPPAGTADPVVGADTISDPSGATPPGCPPANDPTATVPQGVAVDSVIDTTPAAAGVTAADATGANPDACPPAAPAAGSATDPAAGATVTASDPAATATP